jgi:hypothetical protein
MWLSEARFAPKTYIVNISFVASFEPWLAIRPEGDRAQIATTGCSTAGAMHVRDLRDHSAVAPGCAGATPTGTTT